MNTTLHALSALLAGVFLNLGLARLAEWFDPLTVATGAVLSSEMEAALPCTSCSCLISGQLTVAG